MDWSIVRREWGAVSFVVTVLIGLIVVPIALFIGNQGSAAPVVLPSPSPTVTSAASPGPSPTTSASPAATPTPGPSPT